MDIRGLQKVSLIDYPGGYAQRSLLAAAT